MARPVPVTAIAQLLKLTERRVQQLVKESVLPRPTRGLYEPVACIHGYLDYLKKQIAGSGEMSLTDERTRLLRCQADIAEIMLHKARGDLMPTKRVMEIFGEVVQAVRQKLLLLPSRLAPVLAAAKNTAIVKDKLEEAIHEVLHECTNPDLVEIARAESSPSSLGLFPTSNQTDGERVGGQDEETLTGSERGSGPMADEES